MELRLRGRQSSSQHLLILTHMRFINQDSNAVAVNKNVPQNKFV